MQNPLTHVNPLDTNQLKTHILRIKPQLFAYTEKSSYLCKRKTETHRGHKDNKPARRSPQHETKGKG